MISMSLKQPRKKQQAHTYLLEQHGEAELWDLFYEHDGGEATLDRRTPGWWAAHWMHLCSAGSDTPALSTQTTAFIKHLQRM